MCKLRFDPEAEALMSVIQGIIRTCREVRQEYPHVKDLKCYVELKNAIVVKFGGKYHEIIE